MVVSDIREGLENTHTMVSDVHQGVTNTQTIISELQRDVTNAATIVSDIHRTIVHSKEGTNGKNQSVSVTCILSTTESALIIP